MVSTTRPSLLLFVLISLIRSITHNPETFKNPMEYDGNLNPDVLDPDSVVFGFGCQLVVVPYLFETVKINSIVITSLCIKAVKN